MLNQLTNSEKYNRVFSVISSGNPGSYMKCAYNPEVNDLYSAREMEKNSEIRHL